jgi:hypothetical protein
VPDVDTLYARLEEMKDNNSWQDKYNEIHEDYKRRVLKTKDVYYQQFKNRLDYLINL